MIATMRPPSIQVGMVTSSDSTPTLNDPVVNKHNNEHKNPPLLALYYRHNREITSPLTRHVLPCILHRCT